MNSLLSEQILSLTVPEKLQLVEDIWDSVVIYAEEIPFSQSHKQDLDRRRSSYQNLENQGDNWENLKEKIIKNDLKVKISPETELDLHEAYQWYESQVNQVRSLFELWMSI